MSGFGFDTFEVTEENRHAYEACREIAALEATGGTATILLGPEGAGKSHLLWAIAKQIRGGTARVGLALIMAREFPEKVRNLVKAPKPLTEGRRAVLLVDQLEQFTEDAPDLEAVVRVFLEHDQTVILATSVHPARLAGLSEDFRQFLAGARVVELVPRPKPETAPEDRETEGTAALRAELESLRAARDGLENRLTQEADAQRLARENAAELEAEVTVLRQERARLEKQLSEGAGAASEIAALNGRLTAVETEANTLRTRLKRAEAEAESAFAEQARLQGQLSARRHAEEELANEKAARTEAESALRTLRNAVSELLAWTDVEAAGRDPVDQLPALVRELEARRLLLVRHTVLEENARQRDEALKTVEDVTHEIEAERRNHAARVTELEAVAARQEANARAAAKEQSNAETRLREAEGRLATVTRELETARRQINFTTAEMDALREEAATQVASANIQLGELQHRLSTLEAALSLHHGTGREVAASLGREAEALARAAAALTGLTGRLGHLPNVPSPPKSPEPAEAPGAAQPALFGDEAFLSLPGGPTEELNGIAKAMSEMESPGENDEGGHV